MSESVFRTKQEPIIEESKPIEVKTGPIPTANDNIETPYLDDKNFLDNYFELGKTWHDQDAKFYPEVEKIERYIEFKIDNGEIGNDKTAVTNLLKDMEKMNNLVEETRSVIKLEILANYVEFLMKNEHLKSNLRRYTN